MAKSKLLEVLCNLQTEQHEDLKAFIQMPGLKIKDRDQVIFFALLDYLSECDPDVDESEIWASILQPEESKDKNRIKNRLLQPVLQYLSISAAELRPQLSQVMLTAYLLQHEMPRNASGLMRKIYQEVEGNKDRNYDFPAVQFMLNELEANANKINRTPRGAEHINAMDQALKQFFSVQQLRLICEQVNRNNILGHQQDFSEEFHQLEQIAPQPRSLEWQAWHAIYKMLTERCEQAFQSLNKIQALHQQYFAPGIQIELQFHLNNFAAFQLNSGNLEYAPYYLKRILHLLENEPLIPPGQIHIQNFKNAMAVAILSDNLDQAEAIFEQQKQLTEKLSDQMSRDYLHFAEASLKFAKGAFEESGDVLQNFRNSKSYYDDAFFKVECDKLQLKLDYYAQEDIELLLNRLETFRHYINDQDRLGEKVKAVQLYFVRIFRKLLTYKSFDLEKEKASLALSDYHWFLKITAKKK